MRLVLLALLASVVAMPAFAQTTPPAPRPALDGVTPPQPSPPPPRGGGRLRARFEAANTTHDGHLTLEQARVGRMMMVTRRFDEIDTAHKGYVTLEDLRTFARAQRAARQAPRPPT